MNIKLGHKAGSGSQRKPVTAPDSASSKSYARIVYGINDGHMVGFIDGLKSLILDNTPVQSSSGEMNITEVEVQTRWGTNDQDYLEGFPSVVNEIGYSNVEIVSDHNFVHYVNDLNTNAVGIRFTWGKIFRQNESNGDINGYRIDYAIDVQTDGNGFVEVLKTSLNDKTSSGYERYHRLELPPAEVGWEIRVRRLTPNATSDFIGDKMFLSAVAEIVDAKLRYPNTALIALKFDADKFGSIPKADFRLRGKIIKVPTNYAPETRTYAVVGEGTTNGIWDGSFKLAYTNNPVWIFYDLLLSKRYGLGERLDASMVDKWALYSIGQYCDVMVPDGMGGTEPRLTCNVYINSKYEAFDLLMQLASTFRGILHWDGASIVATADRPSDPVFTFTRANIIGEFNYSGTRARDRSSMISVAFDDPANNYKTDKEVVSDTNAIAEVGVRLKELTAFGCTSRGQAQRIGRLGLLKEQQELRMVTFTVGLDGYIPVTGKIIEIADPLLAGRAIGGRISVVSADGTVITLDREVTANAGDVLVANGDDGIQQRRDITQVNGNVVTVSAAFTGVSAENVWAIDSEDLSLMRFRVLSVAQNRSDDGLITFTISGVQHNPSIDEGADFSAYIEQPTYSNIEIYTQVAPTELVIGSENVINQGLDITNVVFSWPQAVNAVKYELEWRRDNGSWIKAPIIYSNTFVVEDVYHGLYEARIVAINSMDVRSLYTLAQPTIINSKFAEPPMLSFIQATGIQFGAEISWVFPARESQNAEYVEVQISYRSDKTDAKLLGNYAYPLNRAEINGLQANLKLWVKARIIDRNKVEGPWTVWVTTTTDAEASILLDALSGKLTSSQLDQDLTTDIATGVAADAKAVAAKLAADAAAQAAATAQATASNAGTAAATAQATASNAGTAAATAQATASNAGTAASAAQTAANNAATAASNAQTTANTAKSTAEQAKADITALTTSTSTTATELRDRLTTAENGLTQEKLDRASGDDAVVGQLNTYKSSNDAALAAVQQKAEAATTTSTSNAQAITNLTTTVNTKNRTYRQSTAPTTNRVVGDLWVNTTAGKNNEVRRWNGTAWDDLTDPRTAANATALSSLQSTVTAIDGRTTANANSITQLSTDLTTLSNNVDAKADASAVDSLTTRVSTAEGNITSQGTRVTNLENSVNHATTGLSTKASSSALTAVDNKVTAANGRIDTTNSDVTTLTGRVSTVEGAVATKAEASALTALTTRVTNAEGVNTSQGSAITTLQNTVNHATTGLATKASTSALTSTNSEVTRINGVVTGHTNQLTQLASDITTINGTLATKANASALNDIYTKTQADAKATEIAAGEVAKYDAKLTIGGSNLYFGPNPVVLRSQTSAGRVVFVETASGNTQRFNYLTNANLDLSGLQIGDPTIASIEIFVPSTDTSDYTIQFGTYRFSGNSYVYAPTVDVKTLPKDTWVKLITASGAYGGRNATDINLVFNLVGRKTAGDEIQWRNFMMEKATTASSFVESDKATQAKLDANAAAITQTKADVTALNGTVTAQGTQLTNLASRVTTAENGLATKADATALTNLTTRVTAAEGNITSQGTRVTSLENSVNHATTGLASKASSAALTTLDNKVTAIDGRVTSNSSSITSLNNSLTTTNTNVTAAQTAATNAMTAAGQKGKVIFGTTVPVADDQLSQNLWIDTTGNANTPKRWNGSAWVVVTDKVATDALAAANAASSLAATKADSSALTALDSKVTTIDGKVTTNASNITTLQGKVTTVENGLATKAEGSALSALTTRVSNAEGVNTSQGSAITTLQNTVNHATTGLATKASSAALTTLDNKVTAVDGRVTTNASNITTLQGEMTAVENGLATKADGSALTALTTRVANAEGGISSQSTALTNLSASLQAQGANLQQDGGFETLTATSGAMSAFTADKYSGSQCLKFVRVAPTGSGGNNDIYWGSLFDVAGSRTYYVEAYVRRDPNETVTPNVNTYFTLGINVLLKVTGAYNWLAAKHVKLAELSNTWSKVSGYVTVPNNYDKGRLWLAFPANANNVQNSSVLIDAVFITDATEGFNAQSTADATSSALTSTNTEVSRINGVVSGHATDISNLTTNIAGKADASALNSLTARVATEEGKSTSQGTAITNLENAVNNATTGLASKASAQALTTLNNQVQHSTTGLSAVNTKVDNLKASVENTTNGLPSKASSSALNTLSNKVNNSTTGLDAIASKTTVLESDVAKALDVVTIKDTRSTNQPPSWYWTNYARRTVNEFKTQTVIGVNGFFGGTYCNLETNIPYSDSSGGHIVQTATSSADPSLYVQRVSTSTTAWGAWAQPLKDLRDGLAGKASASAVESLTTRVSTAEGTISSEASKLSTLSTTVGGHTSSISTQQTSINGLNAKATIQVAAGNTIGGIALGNNGGNVEFIVRSNVFAVAPPVGYSGSNKYLMTYRATPITLPNGTVVSEGLYLNNLVVDYIDASKIYATSLSAISANLGTIQVGSANIADLAVTTAKIGDAQITTAKIGDAQITTAKIGDLQVDTLKIKDDAVSIGIGTQGVATITTISNGGKLRLDIGLQAYYSATNTATTMGIRVLRNGVVIRTFNFPATYLGSEGLTRFSYTCALPPVMETIAAGTTVTYRLQITDYNGNWKEAGSNGVWVGNSGLSMAVTELKK